MRLALLAVIPAVLVQGCGLKGPLFIPTPEQERETARREQALEERERREREQARQPPAPRAPAPQAPADPAAPADPGQPQ